MKVDVPDLDPSKKEQIMFAAQELIKAGAGTLELPATGENMMKWLEAQPRIWPEAKHDRFIKQMNGIVEEAGWAKKSDNDTVAELFERLLEIKGIAPMKIKPYIEKMKAKNPKTVWDSLCAYNANFL